MDQSKKDTSMEMPSAIAIDGKDELIAKEAADSKNESDIKKSLTAARKAAEAKMTKK